MGYTTKFDGKVYVDPPMTSYILGEIRDYVSYNDKCDWRPGPSGEWLEHNNAEKSHEQDQWLMSLISQILMPGGYSCNGIVTAQGEDVGDVWRIVVTDNRVIRDNFPFDHTLEGDGMAFTPDLPPLPPLADKPVREFGQSSPKPDLSYAEKVKAPLSREEIDALNEALASGNVPRYRRPFPRGPLTAMGYEGTADDRLNELRIKLGTAPEEPPPAVPIADVGQALKDLGHAISGMAAAGAVRVADFLESVLEALELSGKEGTLKPLADVLDMFQTDMADTFQDTGEALSQNEALAREMLANGGVYEGGITFVSPEARDKFYAAVEAAAALDDDLDEEATRQGGCQIIGEGIIECSGVGERLWDDAAEDYAEEARAMAEEAAYAYQELLEAGVYGDQTCWLLWSNKYSLWWMPREHGYTDRMEDAGRYSMEDAASIVRRSARGWDPSSALLPQTVMVPDPACGQQ